MDREQKVKEWEAGNGEKWERRGYVAGKATARFLICVLAALLITGFLLLMVALRG
jgi:hypothetical protein